LASRPAVRRAEGIAADIAFAAGLQENLRDDQKELTDAARMARDGAESEPVAQLAQGWCRKLLAAYMDSTMIRKECIDEAVVQIGPRPHVAALNPTERPQRSERAR
jgi:hypothetical protein